MTTKENILSTALKLFNDGNTQAATTNHIAAAAGISPGNLHYHYKNREAIILKLYEQMHQRTALRKPQLSGTLRDLNMHFHVLANVFWEYRFFHRELLFLLSRDPVLKQRYVADTIAHRARIVHVLGTLRDNGYLDLPYENVLNHLADETLLATQFWNGLLETLDHPLDAPSVQSLFAFLEGAMRPYLTAKGLAELAALDA